MLDEVALRVLRQRWGTRRQVRKAPETPDFRAVLVRTPPASGLRSLELMASQQTNCTGDGDVVLKGIGQQSHQSSTSQSPPCFGKTSSHLNCS